MDDNFGTIIRAIAEGRQLFQNLRMSFAFLLMIHIPLVTTAALIPLLGYPLLYLPVHIVWLELFIHPAAIIGFQQSANLQLELSHRQSAQSFFSPMQWLGIVVTGVAITGAISALFIISYGQETVEHARSMALVALTIALTSLFVILTRLQGKAPIAITALSVMAAFLFTSVSALSALLHMHLLSPSEWLVAAAVGAVSAIGGIFVRGVLGSPLKTKEGGALP